MLNSKDVKSTGWSVAPQLKEAHSAVFVTKEPLSNAGVLTFRLEQRYKQPNYTLGRFRLSVTNDPQLIKRAALPAPILAILDTPAEKRTKEQEASLAQHYRSIAPALQSLRDEIAKVLTQEAKGKLAGELIAKGIDDVRKKLN